MGHGGDRIVRIGTHTGDSQLKSRIFQHSVPTKNERLYYELRLIGTVSRCYDCHASESWLGNCSPIDKVRKNGLWQVIGLNAARLTKEELLFVSNSLLRSVEEVNGEKA